jgi:DNA-binding response OmpR family regulator
MLTAQAHDSALLYGKQAGAAHYMTKPFNPAELAAVMRQVLADAKDDDGPAS